ncbi:MAG: hypothetical protein JW932_11580 [Deltaproteobacteria bacterium]|nr:hypothetical protein [Deltaproteobacteria bacterium]
MCFRNILIIRPGALGDTLMLMPAIAQLHDEVEILLVGRYPGIDYLKPYVSQCFDYEARGWHMLFSDTFDKAGMPMVPQVDIVLGFLSDPESRVARNLKIRFPESPIHIFPPFPPEGKNIHVALYIAQSLRKSGLPVNTEKAIDEAVKHPLIQRRSLSSKEHIVLHAGSGSEKKNYSSAFWIELIKTIKGSSSNKNTPVILLLGPAEQNLLSYYRDNLRDFGIEFYFSPDKEKLLSILSQASLYIGHDSGITHLAAMMGVNVIALFKESSISQWQPLGPAVNVLQGEWEEDFIGKIVKEAFSF